jgi:alpha-tubulin suppressor-like RCC1 family protein
LLKYDHSVNVRDFTKALKKTNQDPNQVSQNSTQIV